jgi:hypothetical protein
MATPVTDCGGTSLHIIFRGARVVADASQQARAAEGACRRVAWISVASGVVLFLLIPVGWYGAYRANQRYDQGGRLVDAAQETAVARQHRPRPCSPGAVAFVAGEGATRNCAGPREASHPGPSQP